MGIGAVVLAVLIAQIATAGRSSDQQRIAGLEREVAQLRAEVNGASPAAKKKKKRKQRVRAGPQGPQGPAGPQGPTGPTGSAAGGMLFGWVEPADLPGAGASRDYSPLGSGDLGISVGSIAATPNSTVVLRDLFVRVLTPPGLMARWEFVLQGVGAGDVLTCSIASVAATTCNSGAQTVTIAPGGNIRLIISNAGALAADPTNVYYAYRAGSP